MYDQDRRNLLKRGGILLAAGALGAAGVRVTASDHAGHSGNHEGHDMGDEGINAVIGADKEGICGTCRYWGGVRRVSQDKKTIQCGSNGWCNNPESHHYQAMTTPTTGPMESWRKWEAL